MRQQVGALPIRWNDDEPTILLVTSRDTRRWIIPKGWPMRNRSNAKAAAREALEEAGVRGRVQSKPIGSYIYLKRLPDSVEECKLTLYLLEVEDELPTFEEMDERRRAWFSFAEAMDQADDAGLRDILRELEPRLRSARAALPAKPDDAGRTKTRGPKGRKAKASDGGKAKPPDAGQAGAITALPEDPVDRRAPEPAPEPQPAAEAGDGRTVAAVADPTAGDRAAAKAKPKAKSKAKPKSKPKKAKEKRLQAAGSETVPRKDKVAKSKPLKQAKTPKPPKAATPGAEAAGRKASKTKASPAEAYRVAAEAAMKAGAAK